MNSSLPLGVPGQRGRRSAAELDDVDRQLIELLTENGRASNRFLAAEVGLSEATVAARVAALHERRILAITAVLDWEAAGFQLAMWLAVEVDGRPVRDVARELAALPSVQSSTIVLGSADVVALAVARDRVAAAELLTEQAPAIAGIRRVRADAILDVGKWRHTLAPVTVNTERPEFPAPVLPLDELDLAMIHALTVNGRQANREIGRQLDVSEGTIRARLRRLEEAGMLRISAQVDPLRSGLLRAFAFVALEVEGGSVRSLLAKLAEMSEVTSASMTSGARNVMVTVAAVDRAQLVELIVEQIRSLPGVRAAETWYAISATSRATNWARLV
ncbi:MAG: Lrp/AsnC family transcriptional regulator [Acidimicrobiales bacterium]